MILLQAINQGELHFKPQSLPGELQPAKQELQSLLIRLRQVKRELQSHLSELQSAKRELQFPLSELQSVKRGLKSPRSELQSAKKVLQSPQSELQSPKRGLQSSLKWEGVLRKYPSSVLKYPYLANVWAEHVYRYFIASIPAAGSGEPPVLYLFSLCLKFKRFDNIFREPSFQEDFLPGAGKEFFTEPPPSPFSKVRRRKSLTRLVWTRQKIL